MRRSCAASATGRACRCWSTPASTCTRSRSSTARPNAPVRWSTAASISSSPRRRCTTRDRKALSQSGPWCDNRAGHTSTRPRRASPYENPRERNMPTNLRRLLGAALLAAACASPAAAQAPQGPWLTLAPFPVPSEEVLGAAANGKMYVFAGLAPAWKPKALVYEYDPATNAWTQKKPMPLPSHHVAFAVLDNKIYAFGGFKLPDSPPPAWDPLNNAWEYDPVADDWKPLAPMPTKRGAA